MKLIEEHRKEGFENYLRTKTNLSEKSVKNYSQAIFGSINNWIPENNEVSTFDEVVEQINIIKEIPDFVRFNAQGNGMYNASLRYLGDFLKSQLKHNQNSNVEGSSFVQNIERVISQRAVSPSPQVTASINDLISDEEVFHEIEEAESLESNSMVCGRKEQKKLRELHLNNAYHARCSICGSDLPTELLVAAHIKKRSQCSLEEKKDLKNIATPMCILGCDALFERGYIAVVKGKIVSVKPPSTQHVQTHIEILLGESCRDFKETNEKYYDWHFEFHKKRLLQK